MSLAIAAQTHRLPIAPIGLDYVAGGRWRLTMRFGDLISVTDRREESAALATLTAEVRKLSGL